MGNLDFSFILKLFAVRIKNRWTFDQTLFNPIRSKRPMNNNMENKTATEVADEFENIPSRCDFCSPIAYTAVGMFKRDIFSCRIYNEKSFAL